MSEEKSVVQLKVRTNIPKLEDGEDQGSIWVDTSYETVDRAKTAWPQEIYRLVKVVS